MTKVEWDDVQGLIVSGYPKLRSAVYILWRFAPGEMQKAKRWLGELAGKLKVAAPLGAESEDKAINVALTASGLRKLGVEGRSAFSAEFLEGMAPPPLPSSKLTVSRRSSQLGDIGCNDPERWFWGGRSRDAEIDGVLLLYAPCERDDRAIEALLKTELSAMEGAAEVVQSDNGPLILKAYLKHDKTEHFGFRDGISQPFIEGTPDITKLTPKQARFDIIKPGEFIIGYEGERDAALAGPSTRGGRDAGMDLQRNGTYLVFRQLEQDVTAFHDFLSDTAKTVRGRDDADTREWVAARLIGRWRSGQPLIDPPFADKDTPAASAPRNDFLYHYEDRYGLACPIGAHIRRANPRDSFSTDPDTALRLSKMHRIIRRGRMYGPKAAPNGADKPAEGGDRRGTYFICLNADIAGQFELIQHSWLSNAHFGGLHDERDPLVNRTGDSSVLTIQQRSSNVRIEGLPQLVTVRGGAYFFMPGVTALRAMAK
jgi:Dyp-type peroxidase family